ncbi:MAG: hypothetical protein ACFFG0_07975 [Candidatus Thorarchaeota archaeon]
MQKQSTLIYFILIIAGIIFLFSQMIYEANQNFDENYINDSEWKDNYDYIDRVNETVDPLKQKFEVMTDENAGWFSKIWEGISAVPYALIIVVPQMVFGTIVYAITILTDVFTALTIPSKLISLGVVILIVFGIVVAIKFWNKTDW